MQLPNGHQKKDGEQKPSEAVHGILRIPTDSGKSPEETRWMQEHHNSNHALWYLSMIVYGIIQGQTSANDEKRTKNILAHLFCLREFISGNRKLSLILQNLLDALTAEAPKDPSGWTHFVYVHWYLIRSFAEHYGEADKCFPETDYEKVSDRLYHRECLKLWWWKLMTRKLVKSFRHLLKNRGGEKTS